MIQSSSLHSPITYKPTNNQEWKLRTQSHCPLNKYLGLEEVHRMKSSILFLILGLTFANFSVIKTNDYKWSQGTQQYINQREYGGVPTGQVYSPSGTSYGTQYSGSYSNGFSGNGYGSTQLSSPNIGVVLPQTLGYGFMGYDIYSLLGNGFYNMMGYALPQVYGLQSIPYLHPHALLQMQYGNLYGYQIQPFQQLGGHLDVYQRYGYHSPFGGHTHPFGRYTNGLWGFSPIGVPMPGLLGPRGNPMFGYKEPGFLERLGFHGVSKDIVTVLGGAVLFAGLLKLG